jgi:hypothetical protein
VVNGFKAPVSYLASSLIGTVKNDVVDVQYTRNMLLSLSNRLRHASSILQLLVLTLLLCSQSSEKERPLSL